MPDPATQGRDAPWSTVGSGSVASLCSKYGQGGRASNTVKMRATKKPLFTGIGYYTMFLPVRQAIFLFSPALFFTKATTGTAPPAPPSAGAAARKNAPFRGVFPISRFPRAGSRSPPSPQRPPPPSPRRCPAPEGRYKSRPPHLRAEGRRGRPGPDQSGSIPPR